MNAQNIETNFFENLSDVISRKIEESLTRIVKNELSKYSVKTKIEPILNTTDFKNLTGISYKKQQYLRETNQITYSSNGRSIMYKREEVLDFIDKHEIPKN